MSYIVCVFYILQWEEAGRGVVEAVLIARLDIMPSAPGPWISASSQTTEDPVLPVLDEPASCNCFRKGQSLYANLADGNNNTCTNIDDDSNLSDHVSELDISDYEADAEESQEDTSHSITMRCAGSAFDRFQPALCHLRSLGADMENVAVELEAEPGNVKDRNALLVKAHFKDEWHFIGYIPVCDIPRVHKAISMGTVTTIKITKVSGKFQPLAGKMIFVCFISLVKLGVWGARKANFKYNETLGL